MKDPQLITVSLDPMRTGVRKESANCKCDQINPCACTSAEAIRGPIQVRGSKLKKEVYREDEI
jgi:hypothetical protein